MAEGAYYRFEVGVVKRSNGHSSVAKAAYHAGEKIRDERLGQMFDFSRKRDVYHTEILAPANAPAWVNDRQQLWNRVELGEKRRDAQVARHFVLSLPTCLSDEEKVAVTKEFIQRECTWRGMIADVAWHDFRGKIRHNPHAHVLLSMRMLEADGFGKKNRDWNDKELLQNWRVKWAEHLNRALEQGHYPGRVDHRSYTERGIDREPMVHEGRSHIALRRDGQQTHLTAHNDNVCKRNRDREQIARLEAELTALRTQRDQQRRKRQRAESTERIDRPQQVTAVVLESQQPPPTQAAAPQQTTKTQHTAPTATDKPSSQRRPKDPTEYAVRRQLEAMGGNGVFEIGILDAESGKMLNKTWDKQTILRFDADSNRYPVIAYLKRQNSAGKHIYVRPAPLANGDSQGLILVDDLDPIHLEEMKDRGITPACVTETSYRNHQAWLRFGDSLDREKTTALAKILANECEGDPASASWQHYGRLAGFTNRKDKYSDKYTGKYPWVRITEATGQSVETTKVYLERAEEQVRREAARQEEAQQKRAEWVREQTNDGECQRALKSFALIRSSASKRYQQYDDSRLDWVTLKRLVKRGYSLPALEYALANGSPDLDRRKKGHEQDYIRRTIENISHDPDVLESLARHPNNQDRDAREQIQQWQQFKDRERDSPASSARTRQERMKQPKGRKASPSFGRGKDTPMITSKDVPVCALGSLDEPSVAWIVDNALRSEAAGRLFRQAQWTAGEDTTLWKDQCRAEYLKELGRYLLVKKAEGYSPYTDVEVATKLRMAGFGKKRIYETLRKNSPFICYLSNDAKTRYLAKGIAPLIDNPRANQKIAQWNQFRVAQAIALPEAEREAYLKEQRLDKLNLSLTAERWEQQKDQHEPVGRSPIREREDRER